MTDLNTRLGEQLAKNNSFDWNGRFIQIASLVISIGVGFGTGILAGTYL